MSSRRAFLFGTALAMAAPASGLGQETPPTEEPAKEPVFIFVQNAKSVTYDNGKLTLKGVGATTVFFADRPQRVTGHLSTRAFVPFWNEGRASFVADPPHATLSVVGQGDPVDVVLELRDPVLKGDDLSYSATVLQGEMPARGGGASLFIDLVGVPPSALAGGAERRTWHRRGYY